MAIYFDLMALDQQERDRKQRALQEAGRIGLQAYLGSIEQNRADALADLKMGQDANNTELIRSAIESRGGSFPEGSVGYGNQEAPIQSFERTNQVPTYAAPERMQEPAIVRESVPTQQRINPSDPRVIRASIPTMNTQGPSIRAQMPSMNVPMERETIRADIPQMQTPTERAPQRVESPKQAAEKTGLPVKEVLKVRNMMSGSGIRGVNGSEYRNNFEDTAAVIFDPKVSYADKLTKLGSYLETDREIRGFYGDNAASDHMLKLLMSGLGGGGKGGVGKIDYWKKGKITIGLPKGTTPADYPAKHPKFKGLGNEDWDLSSPTDVRSREKEKVRVMEGIARAEKESSDTENLEAQLAALNYGDPTKPKIVATPNWNNAFFGLNPYGTQGQTPPTRATQPNEGADQPQPGIAYRRPGAKGLWKWQDGEWVQVTERVRGF